MPVYEYRCSKCARVTTIFLRSYSSECVPVCKHCGSEDIYKLVSQVAVLKSEESRLDNLANPSNFGNVDENDPHSVASWYKHMGQGMGEGMGDEFREMVARMDSGETPEEIIPTIVDSKAAE